MRPALDSDVAKKPNRELFYLSLHFVLLGAVQTAYAYAYIHSPSLRNGIVLPNIFRLSTWTLPAFLALMVSGANPFDYLRLRNDVGKGVRWGVTIGIVLVAGNLIGVYFVKGHWNLNFNFGPHLWIGPVLLVGLSEEVLFRGFFLQKFAEHITFLRANLLQAFLFLLIHVPGWILLNQFKWPAVANLLCYIFGIGLVLGIVLKKSNSLWACMIVHSFSNFASFAVGKT
jgi:membrane protease YdiL (CAAX protease family)